MGRHGGGGSQRAAVYGFWPSNSPASRKATRKTRLRCFVRGVGIVHTPETTTTATTTSTTTTNAMPRLMDAQLLESRMHLRTSFDSAATSSCPRASSLCSHASSPTGRRSRPHSASSWRSPRSCCAGWQLREFVRLLLLLDRNLLGEDDAADGLVPLHLVARAATSAQPVVSSRLASASA